MEADSSLVKYDPVSKSLIRNPHTPAAPKPHVCRHPKAGATGGICGSRFERSEHLKRHQNMHSNERQFQCPFTKHSNPAKKCKHEKGVSRSDNAGDHFKSHLKDTKKGRRNPQLQWPEIKEAILFEYDPKAARKLITNLEKWIREKDDGLYQRHWLDPQSEAGYGGIFH